ncbi:Stk1 family PASTA domain-containing Ser/Thr kinase [Natronosporangium hydrolyticum]|uniref:non-specific serine/threonine protein kinase n=1 Tax=Natronosporangium hydrolyticum TaxID=2811111 RepID=A0A895YKY3_9ACTN|nr:Stk1 family PASTA domain-containing Ser/Thr kinase [Natronosporangium hydrolyticum]QSB14760.1 Stk1 family PASTA domain-containing Ser/Thr kinase [Natronosporangium hydrolyticum]
MSAPERLLGGRYEVGELLGYGGMAEVHRGRDRRLGRDVAIKMLRTDLARDHTFQLRFRREAQNSATLNHPGIAAVYDTGEEKAATGEALPYIVMEFVNGQTLKDVLAAEQVLQPRRALEVTADICAALEFSHRHGIIHRDVKPGNAMITTNGQVKVMDFGIARDLASGATTMTQTSAVIGTAQYLSPEQARGEAVDARSDVYATGCLLFELLCGDPPFTGDSPVSVAYQHVREDPKAPSEVNPEIGPDIDAVVLKALAKNPANRYQSAAEMRADLLRAASGRPVLATPVMSDAETAMLGQGPGGEPARVGDPQQRKASTWVLAALGVLGVLAVIALITGLILSNQGSEQVVVPNLEGMTEEEASEEIDALELAAAVGEPLAGDDCEEDTVVAQSPGPGEEVEPASVVTFQLCAGPEAFPMPNVVGSTEESAVNQLRNAGLDVTVEDRASSEPSNTVVETDPEAGEDVLPGDEVTIYVSQGNIASVPDVVGLSEAEARGRLEGAGFTVNTDNADSSPSSPDQAGTVAGQNPSSGEEVNVNETTVTIFIYADGQALQISEPVVGDDGVTVVINWDNDIFGGVTIDWGDGTTEDYSSSEGPSDPHTYQVAPGDSEQFTITVTAQDDSSRSQSVSVTIEPEP